MEEQSDTPRTDWAAREAGGSSSFAALGWRLARDLERELSVVKRERDEARADLGIERMRLVACGVIALANTPESAARARDILPQYRSASSAYVTRAVDREMQLRAEVKKLRAALQRLACLGNGDRPGNSEGNVIALEALAATEPKP